MIEVVLSEQTMKSLRSQGTKAQSELIAKMRISRRINNDMKFIIGETLGDFRKKREENGLEAAVRK